MRNISRPPTLIEILKEYKEKQKNKSEFVCTLEDGSIISPSSLNHKFKQMLEDNNFPHIRFHDLRHFYASLLLAQGVSAKAISTRLGHCNISITMDLYSHICEATNKELANDFDIFKKTS